VLESGTYKLKEQHLFESMSAVVVSSLTDGMVIMRLPTDTKDCKVSSELDGQSTPIEAIHLSEKLGVYCD